MSFRMIRQARSERIEFFVIARSWLGEPMNREPAKCDRIEWFSLSDLSREGVPYVRHALHRHLLVEWFYEHGWDRE